MRKENEFTVNIQLVNTSTYTRGISAQRKSSINALAWFVLIFAAIGYLLTVAFFAG